MTTRSWWVAWVVSTLAGSLLATSAAAPGAWLVTGALGAGASLWVRSVLDRSPRRRTGPLARRPSAIGVGAASGVALTGFSAVHGLLAPSYAIVLLAGLAALVLDAGDRVAAGSGPSSASAAEQTLRDQLALRSVVRRWSDDQLRWAWSTSLHRTRHPDAGTRAQTTAQREVLLDELERRDPVRFRAWLGTHPSADSAPGGHLHQPGAGAT